MNLVEFLDQIPPAVCRLVACQNHGWKPMSHRYLAGKAGLRRSLVADLSMRMTWERVDVAVAQRFAEACGVDLLHPGLSLRRLRNNLKPYLKRAGKNQARFYSRLMEEIVKVKRSPGSNAVSAVRIREPARRSSP